MQHHSKQDRAKKTRYVESLICETNIPCTMEIESPPPPSSLAKDGATELARTTGDEPITAQLKDAFFACRLF